MAQALTFAPTISFEVAGNGGAQTINSNGTNSSDGDVMTWTLNAPLDFTGGTVDSWMVELKEDPFVTNNLVVQNNTGVTQSYIASVVLPIPAFPYDRVINSSFGVTATDGGAGAADGIINVGIGSRPTIYTGMVNGSSVLALDPVTGMPITQANCPGGASVGCTALAGNNVALLFIPAGVATSIGLELNFTLSAGDSAGLTSRFEIIPEPTTALLVGLGLIGLGAARRRS